MSNLAITGILEKMTGKDKDYRYMATSDLLNELSKDGFKADIELEVKLSHVVLQQLEDVSGDVSGLAVKCLVPLVKKIGEDRVLEMTNKLCDKLLNGKDQHRDIASIALKTIISEVSSQALAQRILVSVTPQLIKGVTGPGKSTEIKCESLDILCDVLHRFGNLMTKDHKELLSALLSQLNVNQASVRKKSVACIASLASSLSDDILAKATAEVVQLLKNKNTKSEITRTNIQMVGAFRNEEMGKTARLGLGSSKNDKNGGKAAGSVWRRLRALLIFTSLSIALGPTLPPFSSSRPFFNVKWRIPNLSGWLVFNADSSLNILRSPFFDAGFEHEDTVAILGANSPSLCASSINSFKITYGRSPGAIHHHFHRGYLSGNKVLRLLFRSDALHLVWFFLLR
ncbi:hypothetical protein KFK09_001059 [Dendrobium nobile]|uniref:TOG domain-containing protein n=1 Tax=Dendrobium nobile TaxID=94219 RepID=A0A8T3CGI9_DENNO|nr:hypothetical protein KFK09_001059 [Dendrobium nobile]